MLVYTTTIDNDPAVNDSTGEYELDFCHELSDDESNLIGQMNLPEVDEETFEDLNLRLVKGENSNNLQAKEEAKKDPQLLYTEIDILIAYELYEEAFELLKKSKANYVDNDAGLDVRELEVLAYLKNDALFFPMFERLNESLSKDYPVEWKKILELCEQIPSPRTKLTAVL